MIKGRKETFWGNLINMTFTNTQIAAILREIAELLSLKDGNRFRTMAYERAATSIEFLDRDVADIYTEKGVKGLDTIEGIGSSIAQKIAELLETGHLVYYERLREQFPAITAKLLAIPGIGPKTARSIAEGLKIETIDALPDALNSTEGKELFGPKTREKILRGYYARATQTRRLPLFRAEPIAEEVLSALRSERHVTEADAVGSLRRHRETVGDIDFVAVSTEPPATFDFIVNQPFVRKVLAKGINKTTFIHARDIQIDIEILPRENYGSLLQYLTGSKEHNIVLRTYAESKGFSLSEWGIKKDDKLITCHTEVCVYGHLGMAWIPPELREDRGEIKAALFDQLPALIEERDIRGDLHVHSNWSDGQASIAEMASAAQKLGREYIAISDHTVGLGVAHGLSEAEIRQRQKKIGSVRKDFPHLKILSGLEVNILADGKLDISDEVLAEMDVVTASIHSALGQSEERITARFLRAMNNPNVDIIGHPSGRIISERSESAVDWPTFFRRAAETGTAIEINASPYRLDLKDTLVLQAKEYGAKFIISTDAHSPPELAHMRYGVYVARRGWLEKEDVLNTLPFPKLKRRLK